MWVVGGVINCLIKQTRSLSFSQTLRKPTKTKGQKEEIYKGDVKYTAQKLYEKGVVLEIEGLPEAQ